jgi:diadenosine tetraphosphate (Ap4A) HIT family hydrolase
MRIPRIQGSPRPRFRLIEWSHCRINEVEQAQLTTEINRVSRALKEITKPDKLNVAALGNVVPQLHVHIIARRTSDAAWPRPVWGLVAAAPYDPAEAARFTQALREKIWIT